VRASSAQIPQRLKHRPGSAGLFLTLALSQSDLLALYPWSLARPYELQHKGVGQVGQTPRPICRGHKFSLRKALGTVQLAR